MAAGRARSTANSGELECPSKAARAIQSEIDAEKDKLEKDKSVSGFNRLDELQSDLDVQLAKDEAHRRAQVCCHAKFNI